MALRAYGDAINWIPNPRTSHHSITEKVMLILLEGSSHQLLYCTHIGDADKPACTAQPGAIHACAVCTRTIHTITVSKDTGNSGDSKDQVSCSIRSLDAAQMSDICFTIRLD